MKKKCFFTAATLFLLISSGMLGGVTAQASGLAGSGSVTVTDSGITPPVDPENPGNEVDPGPGPSTEGDLRIDFVSTLNFGSASTAGTNRTYPSLAQLFYDDTSARGFYIQVTDRRANAAGWTLTLSQDQQLTSEIVQDLDHQELDGAVLSFDKGWANSTGNSGTPNVSRETIAIQEMNTAYQVATATSGQGTGIWTIAFGASGENSAQQENTLSAITDAEGNPILDTTYNKPTYHNSAITLTVPDDTRIYPVQYSTTLTWTLEAGPTE